MEINFRWIPYMVNKRINKEEPCSALCRSRRFRSKLIEHALSRSGPMMMVLLLFSDLVIQWFGSTKSFDMSESFVIDHLAIANSGPKSRTRTPMVALWWFRSFRGRDSCLKSVACSWEKKWNIIFNYLENVYFWQVATIPVTFGYTNLNI